MHLTYNSKVSGAFAVSSKAGPRLTIDEASVVNLPAPEHMVAWSEKDKLIYARVKI